MKKCWTAEGEEEEGERGGKAKVSRVKEAVEKGFRWIRWGGRFGGVEGTLEGKDEEGVMT